jgi:hypothetical protein
MKKTEEVIYVDPQGREHKALVTALNGLNPGYISVVYVDGDAPENENIRRVYDIPHFKDSARSEHSADLPDIHLNCWKEIGEEHTAPASDHPMFDHPFAEKAKDEFGQVLEPERPEHSAMVAEHVASLPSAEDLDAAADEEKAKEATNGKKNGKPKPVAVGK